LLERGGAIQAGDSPSAQKNQPRRWFSHQRLLSNTRAISAGPARLLREKSLWPQLAADHPKTISRKEVSTPPLAPVRAAAWGNVAGDPGWAGLPLEAYKRQQSCRMRLPQALTADRVLDLLVESQSLLEATVRWKIPLAYQAWLPAKYASIAWQVGHSVRDLAASTSSTGDEFALDLTQSLGEAGNPFADNARDGNWVQWQRLNPDSSKSGQLTNSVSGDSTPRTEEADGYQLRPLTEPIAELVSKPSAKAQSRPKKQTLQEPAGRSPISWLIIVAASLIPISLVSYLLTTYWPFLGNAAGPPVETRTQSDDPDDLPDGVTTDSAAPLTARESILISLAKKMTTVALPNNRTLEAVPLIEFDNPREEVRQLEFGLALPKEFLNLTFFPGPENEDLSRNLKSGFGEGDAANSEAEVRLRKISNAAGEKTLFLWRWLTAPPTGKELTWRMGALQVGEKGKPAKLTLPLEAPQREPARTLLSFMTNPLEIPYLHPAVSKLPSEVGKLPWVVDSIDLAERPTEIQKEGDITWSRSERKLDDMEYGFTPNREQLEAKIRKRLNAERYSKAEQAITEEIVRYPNFGFCLTTAFVGDEPLEDGKLMKLRIIPQIIIPRAQSSEEWREGNLITPRNDKELTEQTFKESTLTELKRLNLADYSLTKAEVERLSDWLDSPSARAPDPEDCRLLTRYLMIEELQRAVTTALERPFRFRVLRRTELQTKNGSQVFSIPAYVFE
jgi:hypothetical protein